MGIHNLNTQQGRNEYVDAISKENKSPLNEFLEDYCRLLGVTMEEITSKRRTRHLADCRAILGYILVERFHMPLTHAGKIINRHHSSIIHYKKLVPEAAQYDPTFSSMLDKAIQLRKAYQDSGVRLQGLQDRFLVSNQQLRNKLLKLGEEMSIDRTTILKLQEKIESLEHEVKCLRYNYA
tara:strand:+ start:3837 stop:4376 length:540 start_codon:yes stop_codon:yes gene_type:complete